jgi:hypothetical protein
MSSPDFTFTNEVSIELKGDGEVHLTHEEGNISVSYPSRDPRARLCAHEIRLKVQGQELLISTGADEKGNDLTSIWIIGKVQGVIEVLRGENDEKPRRALTLHE